MGRDLDYRALDDDALMRRVGDGDASALEALVGRYADVLYSVTVRILHSEAAAQDVVQDVFVRLWRRPEQFDSQRGRFVPWLLSVARHRAIDERRSADRRLRHEGEAGTNHEILRVPDGSRDPAVAALLSEDRAEVRRALAGLPDEQRRAIELAYFGGLTQREIAQALQQPLGTVKTRIRLGMQKLRSAMTGVSLMEDQDELR